MATPGFELLFQNLEQIGFFEFVLPLILFMAIFFGILRKTEVLGDDEAVQGAAAVALAFLTTFGIYVFIPFSFFPQFFGALSILIVLILGMMIIMGMAGFDVSGGVDAKSQRYMVAGVILIVIIAFPALFTFAGTDYAISEQHANFVLTLALIAVIGYIISKFGPGAE